MSTTIDNKVVEMSFDNSNFEQNVQQSLGTLDKLKQALKFDKVKENFNEIDEASKNVDFSELKTSIDSLNDKFTASAEFVRSKIEGMFDMIWTKGTDAIKSMSVDQITAGWGKFEDKTTAVQTIMSATTQTWEEDAKAIGFAGTQMEYVSEQLNKLNWFSDETSYSFTDMTGNIGKFTSAGVNLSDAVTAMEGISTWAAKSGQGVNEASRAMYNLSQALGTGVIKLMDWRSVENANMSTLEFKNTVLETAAELGVLKKASDGMYYLAEDLDAVNKGTAKLEDLADNAISAENFATTLEQKWFTSDVLMSTLEKYGKAATKLSEISAEYGTTASQFLSGMDDWLKGTKTIEDISSDVGISVEELIPLFEELNTEEYKLGMASFKMAQEAKTFREAIDATKDAVSTGWMTTFETIFGNYEEAKVLWTDLANALWDVFAASGETRNEILALWKSGGGRDDLIDAFWALWDAVGSVTAPIKEAFGKIFPSSIESSAQKLLDFTANLKEFNESLYLSEENADMLRTAFEALFSILKPVGSLFGAFGAAIKTLTEGSSEYGSNLREIVIGITSIVTEFNRIIDTTKIFKKVLIPIAEAVRNAFRAIFPPETIDWIKSFEKFIMPMLDKLEQLEKTLNGFEMSAETLDKIQRIFQGLFAAIDIGIQIISAIVGAFSTLFKSLSGGKGVLDTVLTVLAGIGDILVFIDEQMRKSTLLETILNGVAEKIATVLNAVMAKIAAAKDGIAEAFDGFADIDLSGLEGFKERVSKLVEPISVVFDKLREVFEKLGAAFKKVIDFLKPIFDDIFNMLKRLGGEALDNLENMTLEDAINGAGIAGLAVLLKKFIDLIGNLKDAAENFDKISENVNNVLKNLAGAFKEFQNNLKAKTLKSIAEAILMITASVIALAMIDPERLSAALKVMATEMVSLFALFESAKGFAAGIGPAKTMTKIAEAVLILSVALLIVSKIDEDKMFSAVSGLTAIVAELVACAKLVEKNTGAFKSFGVGVIAIAGGLDLLMPAFVILSLMPLNKTLDGAIGLGLILAEFIGTAKLLKKNETSLAAFGGGVIAIAAGLDLLLPAFVVLSLMPLDKTLDGVIILAAVLGEFIGAAKLLKKNEASLAAFGGGIIAIAAGIDLLLPAMIVFSLLPIDKTFKGLLSVAIILGMFVAAAKLLNKNQIVLATMGTSLLEIAAAMYIMGKMVHSIGGMKTGNLIKGLLGFVVILGALIGAAKSIGPAVIQLEGLGMSVLTLGAGLLLAAIAANIFVKALKNFIKIFVNLSEMGLSIADFLGDMLSGFIQLIPKVFGAIAEGLYSMIEVLVENAPGILEGLGELIISTITTVFKAAIKLFLSLGDVIIKNGPQIYKTIKSLVELALKVVKDVLPDIMEIVKTIAGEVLQYIIDMAPKLAECLLTLWREFSPVISEIFDDFIEFLIEEVPYIIDGLLDMFDDLLLSLDEHIPEYVDKIMSIVHDTLITAIDKAAENIKELTDHLFDFLISLIEGFTESLVMHASELGNALKDLIAGILVSIYLMLGLDELGEGDIKEMVAIGWTCIKSIGKGILSLAEDLGMIILQALVKANEWVTGRFEMFFGGIGELFKLLFERIRYEWKKKVRDLKRWWKNLKETVHEKFKSFVESGKEVVDFIVEGIKSAPHKVYEALKDLFDSAINKVKEFFGIASPSREFEETGNMIDAGMAKGLREGRQAVINEISQTDEEIIEQSKKALEHMKKNMESLADELEDNINISPVISPVIDLTDFNSSINSMKNSVSGFSDFNLQAGINGVNGIQNGMSSSNSGVNGTASGTSTGSTYTFIQNNTSPKALSETEIYRQTKNQFSQMKGLVGQ